MSKGGFLTGIVVGIGIAIVLVVILVIAIPEIYLYSENRNFAKLREKSKLSCLTMPLHCLVRNEDIEGISKYANSGQDLELKDKWGRTALYWALWNNKPHIASHLLSLGADSNTKDENGVSVFQQAIVWGKYDFADQLLDNGADIDALNGNQYPETTLHHCVMKNKPECVRYLIDHKADIYLEDSFGYTVFERIQAHEHISEEIGQIFEK